MTPVSHGKGCTRRDFVLLAAAFAAVPSFAAASGTRFDAKAAWEALVKAYWLPGKAQFRKRKGNDDDLLDFWLSAHAWDAIIDVSRLYPSTQAREMVPAFYDAFMKRYPDWKTNTFNDDILWWTISCTRAYSATKQSRYLQQARTMFDWLAEREIDDTLGGGMWWKNTEHQSKNACDNFPAVITACNLHKLTRERKYLETAKSLYSWAHGKFFDETTGAVYDSVNTEGQLNRWDFSYNTGTFIGSALRLHRATGKRCYMDDALKAARHLTTALSQDGTLKPLGQGDGGTFNGIGARYLAELAATGDGREFATWIQENAATAWAHRRDSDALVGDDWSKTPAADFDIECQTANSAVTLMLVAESLRRKKGLLVWVGKQHAAPDTMTGRGHIATAKWSRGFSSSAKPRSDLVI